jgi:hypothetical protein
LTCHIDEYELDKIAGSSGANARQMMLGDGWRDPYVLKYLRQALNITEGWAFTNGWALLSGGWSPKNNAKELRRIK